MNWNDLKVCLAVARDGSIRAAASRLGVNHATVSRRINALEEQLGVRLFDRLPSGYVCTPYGEDMFREAQHLEETVHSLERRLIGQDANLTGDIRVTIPSTLARLFMPDFAAFAERHLLLQPPVGEFPLVILCTCCPGRSYVMRWRRNGKGKNLEHEHPVGTKAVVPHT